MVSFFNPELKFIQLHQITFIDDNILCNVQVPFDGFLFTDIFLLEITSKLKGQIFKMPKNVVIYIGLLSPNRKIL